MEPLSKLSVSVVGEVILSAGFSNLRVHFVCQQLVPLNLTSMEDNAEGEEFSARNFAHIHNSSANVLSGEVFNPKYLPSNMMLYPVKGNGRPNTSYGRLERYKNVLVFAIE